MSSSNGPISAQFMDGWIADDGGEVAVAGPELLAKGFRPYERFRFSGAHDDAPRTADILRAGPAAAVLPVDLTRDEIVMLRQFRLAAHVALASPINNIALFSNDSASGVYDQ